MIPPCLTLSLIRYVSRVKWSKRPSIHLGVVAIEKGVFWSPLTTVANFTYYITNMNTTWIKQTLPLTHKTLASFFLSFCFHRVFILKWFLPNASELDMFCHLEVIWQWQEEWVMVRESNILSVNICGSWWSRKIQCRCGAVYFHSSFILFFLLSNQ